jgi:hypothetical protein
MNYVADEQDVRRGPKPHFAYPNDRNAVLFKPILKFPKRLFVNLKNHRNRNGIAKRFFVVMVNDARDVPAEVGNGS